MVWIGSKLDKIGPSFFGEVRRTNNLNKLYYEE